VPYTKRLVEDLLALTLASFPAASLVGPRAAGKTTTARRFAKSTAQLDRPAQASIFAADPDAALASMSEPALIDEWQEVPETLGAVKRLVDDDPHAGRFILTGSVRSERDGSTWAGTGRILGIPVYPMTESEVAGRTHNATFVARARADDPTALRPGGEASVIDYLQLALRGGFPQARLAPTARASALWAKGYLDQLLTLDAKAADGVAESGRLAAYFEAWCLNSAGVTDQSTLIEHARLNRKTADRYDALLTRLYVVDEVPAWWTNRVTRLTSRPKRFVVDTGLMAAALRLNSDGLKKDGNLIGRFLESFVAMQLRPQIVASHDYPRLFHLRDKGGRHEIDLIVEYGGGDVVGIEVKATASPGISDARHLLWLREELGDRFLAGIVLHTGPAAFRLADGVVAAPISTLWA
jgi:predicted AAA+ superfamily ATPase